jgi:thiol-disulfide isomerase/thioredoxin
MYRSIIGKYDAMPSDDCHSIRFLLFTAKWCEACRNIEALFDERSEIFKKKADFLKFDIDEDENDQIAVQYKILKIPTIIVIINNRIANHINDHLNDKNLDIIIKTYLTKPINEINRRQLLMRINSNSNIHSYDEEHIISS